MSDTDLRDLLDEQHREHERMAARFEAWYAEIGRLAVEATLLSASPPAPPTPSPPADPAP